MTQPALPISRRDTRGQACVKSLVGIKRRTGVSMPKPLLLKMAFDSGYEAGAEDAGSGELLVEALDLRYALNTLDGKIGRAYTMQKPLGRSGAEDSSGGSWRLTTRASCGGVSETPTAG